MTPDACRVCGLPPDVVEVPGGKESRWSVHCPKQHDWAIARLLEKAVEVWNRSNRGQDRRGDGIKL
jgi:hypothetical protein